MSKARPKDTLARWWFVALVMLFAGAAATRAVVAPKAQKNADPPPPRVVHNPDPGRLDAVVRDPFMTGTEWRVKLRERSEGPAPAPSASGAPVVVAPPPPGSELGFAGTMRSGSTLYAILNSGMVREGAQVGRYTVEEIRDDQLTISFEGQRVTLRITASGAISTVTTGTAGSR